MVTRAHNVHGISGILVAVLIGTALMATSARGQGPAPDNGPEPGTLSNAQIDAHDDAEVAKADPVDQQLARYARLLPDMGFLRLYDQGGANMVSILPLFLGEGASNADYEHDESARENLLELQMKRIALMVRESLPSATLFKTGLASQFEHPYLCVITLDADKFRRESGLATRLLAPSLTDHGAASEPAGTVGVSDFLRFTIDHEVFHCLNAYYNGPNFRKTRDELRRVYQEHINEAQADAFASQMFMREGSESVDFLRNVAALRMLSVLDLDIAHFTGDMILQLIGNPESHPPKSLRQRVEASRALVSEIVPSATEFAQRLADVVYVAERLGRNPAPILDELADPPLPRPTEAKVNALLDSVAMAERRLTSAPVPRNSGVLSQFSDH